MKNHTKENPLQPLVTLLRCCPSREPGVTRQVMLEGWSGLRLENFDEADAPSPAIMAALLLNSSLIAQLLDPAERAQLRALVNLGIERYEQTTNPPKQLGKLIAGILKEST